MKPSSLVPMYPLSAVILPIIVALLAVSFPSFVIPTWTLLASSPIKVAPSAVILNDGPTLIPSMPKNIPDSVSEYFVSQSRMPPLYMLGPSIVNSLILPVLAVIVPATSAFEIEILPVIASNFICASFSPDNPF